MMRMQLKYAITVLVAIGAAQLHAAAVDSSDLVVEMAPIVGVENRTQNINENCRQPKETGRCFALFHRFAFNVENFACEQFIYGGCAGNQNNFETLEECERACLQAAGVETPAEEATAAAVTESQAAVSEPLAAVSAPLAAVSESPAAVSEPLAAVNEPLAAVSAPLAAVSESPAAVSKPLAAVNVPSAAATELPAESQTASAAVASK